MRQIRPAAIIDRSRDRDFMREALALAAQGAALGEVPVGAVLHSVEAGNDPVADAGCGLTVAPESAAAVAQGLQRLASATPEQRQQMGERGKAYVLAHHTYPVLARRFIEAVA